MTLARMTAIVFCFCVGACSLMVDKNTHDYPQVTKDAFMASCMSTSGGKKDACSCMLTKVQEHYTYGEMRDIEEKLNGGQPPPEFTDFMHKTNDACATAGSAAMPSRSPQR